MPKDVGTGDPPPPSEDAEEDPTTLMDMAVDHPDVAAEAAEAAAAAVVAAAELGAAAAAAADDVDSQASAIATAAAAAAAAAAASVADVTAEFGAGGDGDVGVGEAVHLAASAAAAAPPAAAAAAVPRRTSRGRGPGRPKKKRKVNKKVKKARAKKAVTEEKKKMTNNPDDLIDLLDNKVLAKRIPVLEGKGPYHPPWTWRTSIAKVREWRELSTEDQEAAKVEWNNMGIPDKDALIRKVRLRNQPKTLWLIARGTKSTGHTSSSVPSEVLVAARAEYEKFYLDHAAAREAEGGSSTIDDEDGEIDEELAAAEQKLAQVELQEKAAWNEMFKDLVAFHETNQHVRVPSIKIKKDETDPDKQKAYRLSAWSMRNRAMYKNFRDPPEDASGRLKPISIGQITPHRIDALERLGFVWDNKSEAWYKMYEELKQYRADNGHLRVSLSTNPGLYRWADRQKLQYVLLKRGEPSHLNPERLELLESIGFQWWQTSPQNSQLKKRDDVTADFDVHYQQLMAFKQKHGHTRVARRQGTESSEQSDGERVSWRLIQWVTSVRKQYKLWTEGKRDECTLDEAKIRLLEEAGLEFTVEGRALSFGQKPKSRLGPKKPVSVTVDGKKVKALTDLQLEARVAKVAAEAVATHAAAAANAAATADVAFTEVAEKAAAAVAEAGADAETDTNEAASVEV